MHLHLMKSGYKLFIHKKKKQSNKSNFSQKDGKRFGALFNFPRYL